MIWLYQMLMDVCVFLSCCEILYVLMDVCFISLKLVPMGGMAELYGMCVCLIFLRNCQLVSQISTRSVMLSPR